MCDKPHCIQMTCPKCGLFMVHGKDIYTYQCSCTPGVQLMRL